MKKKKILFSVVPTSTRSSDVVRNPIKERRRPIDNERQRDRTDGRLTVQKEKRKKKNSKSRKLLIHLSSRRLGGVLFSRFILANKKKKKEKKNSHLLYTLRTVPTNQIKSLFISLFINEVWVACLNVPTFLSVCLKLKKKK